MKILVAGGAGFIGSHTCVALLEAGHQVAIADNFSNSKPEIIDAISQITQKNVILYNIDVTQADAVERVFSANKFDGIIHFAGFKAVGESVSKPLDYYYNNLLSTMVLAQACIKHKVPKFVFSSSATVYGNNTSPLKEDMLLLPTTNPYGETKAMSERILSDSAIAHPELNISLLRYFNPIGAHDSGLIGESPNGIPNNLMPFLTQVASGQRDKLKVFGNDYPTVDGTGVRDYIHVVDLAAGHVAALESNTQGLQIYNLGTGIGTSVLELINAFKEATGITIPYEIVARRPGDLATCFADAKKAQIHLGWTAKKNIFDMCLDAWRFESGFKKD